MATNDTRKVAIYSRKSKFTGKGESIGNQIELCKQRLFSMEVPEEDIVVFEDEGFSGGNTNRPQFKAMMEAVRREEVRCVIVYRLDRISRNVADFANIQNEFEAHKVDFISLRDNFDTTTPTGRAMMLMTSVFSQLERETIAERIKDNMHELAKSGRWLGGTPPTGFRSQKIVGSVTIDGKERSAFMLVEIPEEKQQVLTISKAFGELRSLTKVDTYLMNNGIKTKNGKDYTRFSIINILKNPVYAIADEDTWNYFQENGIEVYADREDFDGVHGLMVYNKTAQKTGKANRFRQMDEWIIAVGKHNGFITGKEWVDNQNILAQNSSKAYRKPRSHLALLSGLLFCGDCGSFMRPKLSQRKNSRGELIYTYMCEKKERSRGEACHIKSPNGNELDRAVCAQLAALAEDQSEFNILLDKVEKALEKRSDSQVNRLASLKKELKSVEKKIEALVESLVTDEGTAAAEYVKKQINALDEQKKKLIESIDRIQFITHDSKTANADLEVLRSSMQDFGKSFMEMTIEQRRAALRVFVRKVVWDGENVHVYLFGNDDGDIEFGNDDGDPDGLGEGKIRDLYPLGMDSERDPYVFPQREKERPGCVHQRAHRHGQGRERPDIDGHHGGG